MSYKSDKFHNKQRYFRDDTRQPRSHDDTNSHRFHRSNRPSDDATSGHNMRDERRRNGRYWLFGKHAVTLALTNPQRKIYKLLMTSNIREEMVNNPSKFPISTDICEVVHPRDLARIARLPEDTPHQGIAASVAPIDQPDVESLMEVIATKQKRPSSSLVILDKVNDPQNIGAILRSCALFGADAVITTQDGTPEESGVIAKSASGALELVPYIRVVNLARTLRYLREEGYFIVGLCANATKIMDNAYFARIKANKIALVFGSEEAGLRRLTQENCDELLKLALVDGPIDSLNVSNATAVVLHNLLAQRRDS